METRIAVRDTVDDLRIFVRVKNLEEDIAGQGGPIWIRGSDQLPILATIAIDPDELLTSDDSFYALALHEITHCLGFGTLWNDFGLLQNPSTDNPGADTHFSGAAAWLSFILSGGADYPGAIVPVENGGDDGHWRRSVFGDELMTSGWVWPYDAPLSIITASSLIDLGYELGGDLVDDYRVPRSVAKPVAAEAPPRCRVIRRPIHVVAEDGRVVDILSP